MLIECYVDLMCVGAGGKRGDPSDKWKYKFYRNMTIYSKKIENKWEKVYERNRFRAYVVRWKEIVYFIRKSVCWQQSGSKHRIEQLSSIARLWVSLVTTVFK